MNVRHLPFLEVFEDASGGNIKTPSSEFLENGEIPVIDQGQSFIAGYVNDPAKICKSKPPVIVFGDHTKAIKYVDFHFAMGADGTKVLVPKNGNHAKYLFHALRTLHIPDAGYSRHYKFLKETKIPLPPLAEQKRIAAILDAADALRAKRREALAQLDALLQSTFLTLFGDPRQQGTVGEIATAPKTLGELTRIRTGKLDANAADDDGAYPFFTCAVKPLRINTPAFDCKAVLVAGNGDLNVKYHEGKFNAYQRTYVIESLREDHLEPRFLFAFLDLYVSELRKQAIGGVIKYIKLPYLTDAVMQLPSMKEQQRFAAIVESVERQKVAQRTHLAELDALFAALQHRAFRGEL